MIILPAIFNHYMTLQRNKNIRFFGESDRDDFLEITIDNEVVLSTNIPKGHFEIEIPPLDKAYDVSLKITGNDFSLTYDHIDIGEVWIAGGQSNMEFLLKYDVNSKASIDHANDSHLRFFDVGEFCFEGEREEGLKPQARNWDKWMLFEPESAPYFSAVGAYFALELRKALDCPVAIVGCNWGGTSASCWMPEEDLLQDRDLKIYMDEYKQSLKKIKNMDSYEARDRKVRRNAGGEQAARITDASMSIESVTPPSLFNKVMLSIFSNMHPMGPRHEWRPSGLYYTMLKLITGFSCRGFLFYQGESDDIHADIYDKLLQKMIERWRLDWKEDLPFLLVQLAPFGQWNASDGKRYPLIRQQQQKIADRVKDVYLASIMDLGSRYDIHPKQKDLVGNRLALLALKYIYGNAAIHADSPRIESAALKGDTISVHFANAPSGLHLETPSTPGFAKNTSKYGTADDYSGIRYLLRVRRVGDRQKQEIPFNYEITDNVIQLHSPQFKEGEQYEISLGYLDYCIMNLYSGALPASPCAWIPV